MSPALSAMSPTARRGAAWADRDLGSRWDLGAVALGLCLIGVGVLVAVL